MCKKNKMKKLFRVSFIGVCSVVFILLGTVVYLDYSLPDDYHVFEENRLKIEGNFDIKATILGEKPSAASYGEAEDKNYTVQLSAFGIIPVKTAEVKVIRDRDVVALGDPFGIKIYADGVLVVGVDAVETENGRIYPAREAGIKVGDYIRSVNGVKVYSNEEVAEVIEKSDGSLLYFVIQRGKKNKTVKVKPALCYQSGKYKSGIWVRDSSAGIGTLTFYSPVGDVVCGLGHGVCDVDTGNLLTLNSGELVEAEIVGVNKGNGGTPGELMGRFKEGSIGSLLCNDETGVYAKGKHHYENQTLTRLALKQEIKIGKAKIRTTINGEQPAEYDCMIEKIVHNDSITKNMVIRITDEELIKKTGGIVQGMSGSPLFQNGKLVGAVTHVFLDDSTCGYAIFAENMLDSAKKAIQRKKASGE